MALQRSDSCLFGISLVSIQCHSELFGLFSADSSTVTGPLASKLNTLHGIDQFLRMYTPSETSSENLQLLQGLIGNMQDSPGRMDINSGRR